MSFKTLELKQFRSYKDSSFEFPGSITIILGPNGSGKTNILEALYILSRGKSFRAVDRELAHHDSDWFKVGAETKTGELEVRYQESTGGSKKLLHKKKARKLLDFVGSLPVVLFEPNDITIVNGGPQYRRRFMDAVLSITNRAYFEALITYRRILKQRNALLRSRQQVSDQIFAWDVKLVELASQLVEKRHQLITYLQSNINSRYQAIAGQPAAIELAYDLNIDAGDYGSELLSKLARGLKRDQLLGHTTAGPHRDDMTIMFDGAPADYNASRGETRTLVLALKQLEQDYMAEAKGEEPVLLLDDVFSELDRARQDYLLGNLKGRQTIITTTDIDGIKSKQLGEHNVIDLGKKRHG